MENLNIILTDTNIIGKVEDLKEYFLMRIQDTLNKKFSTEEKIDDIRIYSMILNKLQNEYDDYVLKLSQNDIGEYYYKRV